MQPYFLPYIGYYQLMKAVDTFIFYDDVNYIKQGWINRNRILVNGQEYLFSLELKGASSFKLINEIEVGNNRDKLMKTFMQYYKKAHYYNKVEPLIFSIFKSSQSNLAQYIIETQLLITKYLNINTKFLISSKIDKTNYLKGQDKVIDICKKVGGTSYINAIGGQELYDKSNFAHAGIVLHFLQTHKKEYKQFTSDFIPWLSIIDVIMFNTPEAVNEFLDQYELV